VKLSILTNTLCGYHKQITEMVERADRDGRSHLALHEKLSAFPAIERERPVEFTAEELSIYIAAKKVDYADDLILLARCFTADLSHLVAFAKLKVELHDLTSGLGTTTIDEAGFSKTLMQLPAHLANQLMVKRESLDRFTTGMCQLIAEHAHFARDVANRFAPVTEAYIGKGVVPSFVEKAPSAEPTN
jgi:hypothetical protein